ncbi:UDP-glucose 4-epimerase GalE [Methanobrevibacter filiformis]|uniref:UDP-glucose 4-epimerase n=1 Tax=Methanobrevibacter filiformis TaxID=55758 RepID=A0A166EWK0_9EURY|nr:UDP-glucose 4-epimerase GalE [Methanobrevibacter filiformis]KZX17089.1 UDP-glucose 4-epimerase [Methanobrevibacter filiformis]
MILITGGAGYIGSHTNKMFNDNGYETMVLDNLSTGHRENLKWGEFVQGDLGDLKFLQSLFKKYDIEGVVHFAALTSVAESMKSPQKYYKNNFINSLNLLKVMNDNNVSKFIFSSSAAVYGVPEETPIVESHPLNPINPYGESKLMVEEALYEKSQKDQLNYASLRYFNASGADPNLDVGEKHIPETHIIPLILDVALDKRDKIHVFGDDYNTPDGTCIRDYIHVNDLAQAHLKAFEFLEKEQSDIFNLGNGTGFSVKEVIDACAKITGEDISHKVVDRRQGDPDILIADSEKAKSILNWKPEFDNLEKIVETAWDWHQVLN